MGYQIVFSPPAIPDGRVPRTGRLAAARLDSAARLSRATYLGALAVDLADGAAPAEVREGGHIEVEGLLLALGVAHSREVAVDVDEVVPVGLAPHKAERT